MVTEATGPIKFAAVTFSAGADLVAAVAGKRIRLLSLFITAETAAGTITLNSVLGETTTGLTGAMRVAANGQISLPFSPVGHVQTVVGGKLSVAHSSAGACAGCLVYQLID